MCISQAPPPATSEQVLRCRTHILTTFERLVDEADTPPSGLREVAEAAFVRRSGMYRYYPDRAGMVQALARMWAQARALSCPAASSSEDCLEHALSWLAAHPRRARFLALESAKGPDAEGPLVVLTVLPSLEAVAELRADRTGLSGGAALAAVRDEVSLALGSIVYGPLLVSAAMRDADAWAS